jgi:hypothetical protein
LATQGDIGAPKIMDHGQTGQGMQPGRIPDLIGITPIRTVINGMTVAGDEAGGIVGARRWGILKQAADFMGPPTPQVHIQVQKLLAGGHRGPTKSFLEGLIVWNGAAF